MLVAEMAMRDPLFERGEWAQLALERAERPGLIGDIGVLWQADDDVAEIGFTLAEAHRGDGLMTEALLAVCEEIHRELGLRLVAEQHQRARADRMMRVDKQRRARAMSAENFQQPTVLCLGQFESADLFR